MLMSAFSYKLSDVNSCDIRHGPTHQHFTAVEQQWSKTVVFYWYVIVNESLVKSANCMFEEMNFHPWLPKYVIKLDGVGPVDNRPSTD